MLTPLHKALLINLKRERALRGFSQARFAELCEFTNGYLAEIEQGHKFPSPQVLIKIASIFNIPPFQLLMNEEEWKEYEALKTSHDFHKEFTDKVIDEIKSRFPTIQES